MLKGIDDVTQVLQQNGLNIIIMADHEKTTELPEFAYLKNIKHQQEGRNWDDCRGLGPNTYNPNLLIGENHLLEKDDWSKQLNVFVHELAHAVQDLALIDLDYTFDSKLANLFASSQKAGLWHNTYAGLNFREYWAETVGIYFNCHKQNPRPGFDNDINTPEELKAYDPEIYALIDSVFVRDSNLC